MAEPTKNAARNANSRLTLHQPLPGVFNARRSIAGCCWVDTGAGAVVIDALIDHESARLAIEKIHQTAGKVEYLIYTHGHLDHIGGSGAFLAERPKQIIASQYLPERVEKYRLLEPYTMRIAAMQWSFTDLPDLSPALEGIAGPTFTFLGEHTFTLGKYTFVCRTARAETDDVLWVWVPELKAAFIGDLVIRSFPNVGNPYKPTRFALGWARALEEVRALSPRLICCGGGNMAYLDQEADEVLRVNSQAIRVLHDQVVEMINQEVHISEMIHRVRLPEDLAASPYLKFGYSRPEFFVYNVYRWYHGYFDHNPAHLLPRPEPEVAAALMEVIGDEKRVLAKAKSLLDQDQAQLALQVLDVLIQARPEDRAARALRLDILLKMEDEDICMMSRSTWRYFITQDQAFLGQAD